MAGSLKKWQENLKTGIKYLGEGFYVEAERFLETSLREAEILEVPVILAFSQRLLATTQVKNNKLTEAESGFKKALETCMQLENKKGISEAKAGLASIYFIKGEYVQAGNTYLQAIKDYPPDSSPLRLAVLYTDLGHAYGKMKKWPKAEESFLKAAELCVKNGYRRGEAEIDLYIGEVFYSQGRLQNAQEMFLRSARIFGLLGEELSLANVHQYLAFICLETNQIEEALFYQERVIPLYLKNEQYAEVSEGYYLLGYILQAAQYFDEAEKSLHYSLKYFQGDEFGSAVRYQSLAVIGIKKKEYEKAKKHYLDALKFFQYYGLGSKIGEISEELTYLLKDEDYYIKQNLYQWLSGRYSDSKLSNYEIMLNLANSLKEKGNNLAALHCGWKALEIARNMEYETDQVEGFIQKLSERIRKG